MIQIEVEIVTQPLQVQVTLNRTIGVLYTKISENFTLSTTAGGFSTCQLTHIPVFGYGYYLKGQKCRVGSGGIITSISAGGLVTFDDDYTGFDFEAVYEY